MVRRGWWAAALLLAACGGGDDDAGPTSTTAELVPATLPADVDPGRGFLVLGGEANVLTVTECAFEPVVDPATGVETQLTVAAQDANGRTVDVVRSSFNADIPTVTDTITVAAGQPDALESSRADRDGLQIDLRVPNAVGSLLEVDAAAGTVRAAGVFGPIGGTAQDPGNVEGELLLRCP
jgi:hypothetical protein